MAIELREAVPWGRTLDEYRRMFSLTEEDLSGRILDVAGGPASFNAELTALGRDVVSVDPLYAFPAAAIRRRVDETYPTIVEGCRREAARFVWTDYADPDDLGRQRLAAMAAFLADYDAGKAEGRYVTGSLPELDFAPRAFDLALCSHFLFLYSEQFDEAFHLRSIATLCRVATEVRIYPLLDLASRESRHLQPALAFASDNGIDARAHRVKYEFLRGATSMLVLRSRGAAARP